MSAVLLFCALLLKVQSVVAIAPNYRSDQDLADSPIIVVAKWEKAPTEFHAEYYEGRRDALKRWEIHTRLRILRTVKGPALAAGEYPLLTGFGIAWNKDGSGLQSGTSTQIGGDVDDVTQPQLWFLYRSKSWDEKRPGELLTVSNYRDVQPLHLEEYFVALASAERATAVPKLLRSKDAEIQRRVLQFIAGSIWPWPNEPSEFLGRYLTPEETTPRLVNEAARIWEALPHLTEDVQPYGVSVYGALAGASGVPNLRTLLNDTNAAVRGVAVGLLTRERDRQSYPRFSFALAGLDENHLACKLVDTLAAENDDRLVPCVIRFLSDDRLSYRFGDDWGVPALRARDALHVHTGHWFPFDAANSLAAWDKVAHIPGQSQRRAELEKLLPGLKVPLQAELLGAPELPVKGDSDDAIRAKYTPMVRVRNITKFPLTIRKYPSRADISTRSMSSSRGGYSGDDENESEAFVTLAPNAIHEFPVGINESFLRGDPQGREMELQYLTLGSAAGPNAWIGIVPVEFNAAWKKRVEVKVEELWPNGNLKSVGQTVNGEKWGEWNFFNEAGDRTHVSDYQRGRGSGTMNTEHPSNKGAGIRPSKDKRK